MKMVMVMIMLLLMMKKRIPLGMEGAWLLLVLLLLSTTERRGKIVEGVQRTEATTTTMIECHPHCVHRGCYVRCPYDRDGFYH